MKTLVVSLGLAAGLLGLGSGTASAQYYGGRGGPNHHHHHDHGGYDRGYGGGYRGGYGQSYYSPAQSFYYGGPPVAVIRPAPYPLVGSPAFGYPGFGYPAYPAYRSPGVSFGLTIVR